MVTERNAEGNKANPKVKQKQKATASVPVRIGQRTKEKMEHMLRRVNKDRMGRRVKADDVLGFALDLMTDQHLAEICNRKLSNKDRLEQLFQKVCKEHRGTTRDEFLGLLLNGKLAQ